MERKYSLLYMASGLRGLSLDCRNIQSLTGEEKEGLFAYIGEKILELGYRVQGLKGDFWKVEKKLPNIGEVDFRALSKLLEEQADVLDRLMKTIDPSEESVLTYSFEESFKKLSNFFRGGVFLMKSEFGKNVNRPRLKISYHSLAYLSDSSSYKKKCPYCKEGLFALQRNEDCQLLKKDCCLCCAQRVRWVEKEINGEKLV